MTISFSTAEELDRQKNKIRNERKLKLTKDRRNYNGNHNLAQTDGLKVVKANGNKRKQTITIDDQEFDLTRIRSSKDLLTEEDIAEMEGWYDD